MSTAISGSRMISLAMESPFPAKLRIGETLLGVLQSPQPPPTESLLIALLNEIATTANDFVLVIDDFHVIDAKPIDTALTFLLENLPPQVRLVIVTRDGPQLPLARLRGGGQLSELRVA